MELGDLLKIIKKPPEQKPVEDQVVDFLAHGDKNNTRVATVLGDTLQPGFVDTSKRESSSPSPSPTVIAPAISTEKQPATEKKAA